jgi:hypothetical protein
VALLLLYIQEGLRIERPLLHIGWLQVCRTPWHSGLVLCSELMAVGATFLCLPRALLAFRPPPGVGTVLKPGASGKLNRSFTCSKNPALAGSPNLDGMVLWTRGRLRRSVANTKRVPNEDERKAAWISLCSKGVGVLRGVGGSCPNAIGAYVFRSTVAGPVIVVQRSLLWAVGKIPTAVHLFGGVLLVDCAVHLHSLAFLAVDNRRQIGQDGDGSRSGL